MEKKDAFLKRINTGETRQTKRKDLEDEAKEVIRTMTLDRRLENYLFSFNLKLDDLKGKKILDIGSGEALFAKEAEHFDLDVTALDPLYLTKAGRNIIKDKRRIKIQYDAVASSAQRLPFKEGQFDMLFFMYSAFYYAESAANVDQFFSEGLRVLKPNGRILIYPLYESDDGNMSIVLNNQDLEEELNREFWSIVSEKESAEIIKKEIGMPNFKQESRARFLIIEKSQV